MGAAPAALGDARSRNTKGMATAMTRTITAAVSMTAVIAVLKPSKGGRLKPNSASNASAKTPKANLPAKGNVGIRNSEETKSATTRTTTAAADMTAAIAVPQLSVEEGRLT